MLNSDCILPGTCNHWHTILYRNIDQNLVNSLHGLLNCETGGLDCRVITRENRTRVDCIHLKHILYNVLVRVIYSVDSGQYSYTILRL